MQLKLGIPSKGRLMEGATAVFQRAGLEIERAGSARGYTGSIKGRPDIDVAFLSASEIADQLRSGAIDLGLTGEDLLREAVSGGQGVDVLLRLGFGRADVVVAVPDAWLDVSTMADLDEVCTTFYARHGRRLRVATKYAHLTRRWFAEKGVTGYRIVESLGATEGAPAAGIAEVIVDITTTGSTLRANHLRVLDDGLILASEAVLAARSAIAAEPALVALKRRLEPVL
ncbi:MAG: ATP phosphoribosyltransferase [Hyphomicrobiales bacterium]